MSESRDLAQADESGGAIAQRPASTAVGIPMDQRMAMLREALTNPDVDPAKATAMADLLWKIEDREREAEFNRAKIKVIRAMPAIFKRGRNTHTDTRYAKFEDMHRAVMPVLAEHGMTLDFKIGSEGRDITVQPILRHESGYIEEGGIMRGPPDQGKGRSDIQAVGSASSYLKRYAMRAMLNIIEDEEDDDGRGGARALESDRWNDRQTRMVEAAERAAAESPAAYERWYSALPTKDRAWMVSVGQHARFGGGPGPVAIEHQSRDPEPDQERQDDPPPAETQDPGPKGKRTPEQMVDDYITALEATKDRPAMMDLQLRSEKFLEGIRTKHPTLNEKIAARSQAHYSKLYSPPADDAPGDPGPDHDDLDYGDDQRDLLGGGE